MSAIALVNHLWQSTVVVLAAALVAQALRRNRASARHAVWLAASLKFLLPFSVLISLGAALSWRTAVPAASVAPVFVETVQTMTEPFGASPSTAVQAADVSRPATIPWSVVLAAMWACGCLVVVALRVRAWLKIRAAVRASQPIALPGVPPSSIDVRATPTLLEPGVVGIWRPVLLVPAGLDIALSADQLRAVVAHEWCHIQRRDNLTSALHMVVEALFWFHPLVWWVGARLLDERERACDEYVLASGAAAEAYAEGILNVCKRYVESPVLCVSGVTGADLKKRIAAILAERTGVRLTIGRRVMLAASVLTAIGIPVLAGAITEPREAVQSSGPVFDVASVRPHKDSGVGPRDLHWSYNAQGIDFRGLSLPFIIGEAYGIAVGTVEASNAGANAVLRGLDGYDIEARAAAPASKEQLRLMLRALVSDRFKLTFHRETRTVRGLTLVVAEGGPRLARAAGGDLVMDTTPQGYVFRNAELFRLAGTLSGLVGAHVVDATGLAGTFDFTLKVPDDVRPRPETKSDAMSADSSSAAEVGAALKPLGLRLAAGSVSVEYFVVDHIEHPTDAQAAPQAFDVVSIRPCENTPTVPGGRNGGSGPAFSPGLFVYNCGTLEQLIQGAYVANGDPLLNDEGRVGPGQPRDDKTFPQRIRGGPDWMRTDRFMIEAKTAVSTGQSGREAVPERRVLMGPMLRALLEDRFKLKVHRDVQADVPMYALTGAPGGLKIKPAGPDSCAPADPARTYQMGEEIETVRKGGKPICGHGIMGGPVGPNNALVFNAQTMESVARFLSGIMDRHVLDKTGLNDKFVIYLEYAPDDLVPYDFVVLPRSTDPPTAPTITQALKSLGLQLTPTKGPKGYLVIDHAERPKMDAAEAAPMRARGAR